MPIYSNRLIVATILALVLFTTASFSFADENPVVEASQTQEQAAGEDAVPPLAMNNADASRQNDGENPDSQTGPVLLVPMVLAVLALVAVSRRKER